MVPITLQPADAGEGDRRIGLLTARSRGDHVERIDDDSGLRGGRVLPAGHFDRQGMARVGKARRLEVLRLECAVVARVRRGSIGVNLLHESSIQKYASDPAVVGTQLAAPADPYSGEGEGGSIAACQRARDGPAAIFSARNTLA